MTSHPTGLQPSAVRPPSRAWFRVLAAGGALVASLAAAEALLRWTYPGDNRERFVRHQRFHHWQQANLTLTITGEHGDFGGHTVHFNGDGLPMRSELPPAGTRSLVFLGDSFTAGIELPEEQRFVTLAGQDLNLPTVSLGCASFSPVLSRLVWQEFAPRLTPAAVVLQLYANDIDGDAAMSRAAVRNLDGTIAAVPHRGALSFYLIRHSALARSVKQAWAARRFARAQKIHAQDDWRADPWSPAFTKPLEEWFTVEQLAATHAAVEQIAAEVQAQGLKLWLLPIPDRGAVRDGLPDHFSQHWRRFAEAHELGYIDLSDAITAENVEQMFFATDIHLSPTGHTAVAQEIARTLRTTLP